jgi:EPS-associated MarR family transcriptional regulator|tara:strand:+ start:514 stop:891 length:378 start_codon:yes stop_codon:yes gene_type:complete
MKKNEEDYFEILRKISSKPEVSQRQLAEELGFSLGKLNYCLKELKNKGLIKIKNFKKNPKKLNYLYVLTPHGITSKTKLTINFMKKKIQEYDELKSEIKDLTEIKSKNHTQIRTQNTKKIDLSLL